MPYKHIAAHLKKTELACRLHYHQLSHGSHRRKRTSSLSSSSSAGSVRHSPIQYHLNGDPHDDFRNGTLHSHTNFYGHMNPLGGYPMASSAGGRTQHKVLLPKPRPLTPEDSPNRMGGLRVSTHGSPAGSSVDTDRLRQIYDSHRGHFWNSIAQEYGTNMSPNHLEEVWRHQPTGQIPTPDESPNGRPSLHQMMQPSPFPSYLPAMHNPVKDFAPMSLPSNAPAYDRFSYGMHSDAGYSHTNSMGLSRTNSWSNGMHQPATAITSLLTEDKCPRHPDTRYCVGGRCV